MKVAPPILLSPLRWSLHTLFVLTLVLAVSGKAVSVVQESGGFKGIQHSLTEFKAIGNSINGDPPESDPVIVLSAAVAVADAPASLGVSCALQFCPMVHQLRDRLMHAPPVLS